MWPVMKVVRHHPWNIPVPEAIRLQKELQGKVVEGDRFGEIRTIAGVDISTGGNRARAAVVILRYPDLQPIEQVTAERPLDFPYVPGLLAFREVPAILDALEKIRREPDVIMADAQGRAHPRRFGLASHLGVLLNKPTIGCAKSRLCGEHEDPPEAAGSWTSLKDKGDLVGAALRTKERTNVVYVSIGHRVSLKSAIRITLTCCLNYRLPEPTRLADQVAAGSARCRPASRGRGHPSGAAFG